MARIERDDLATAETIGLTLEEGKQLTAAAQAEIVRGQVAVLGKRSRTCEHCATTFSSKGPWLGKRRHRDVERAKWRLWHGR